MQEAVFCAHMVEHPYWPVGNEKKSPPTASQAPWISDAECRPAMLTLAAQASLTRTPDVQRAMMRMINLRIETSRCPKRTEIQKL